MTHRNARTPSRPGTTLVELMAALALAGIVMTGAFTLLSTLRAFDTRMAQRATAIEAMGLSERQLRAALQMIDVGDPAARPFTGERNGARFSTRCTTGGGWLERCAVEIQLVPVGDSITLRFREGAFEWIDAMRAGGDAHLVFLERGWESDDWRTRWRSPVSVPIAVALVNAADTVVFLGGGR